MGFEVPELGFMSGILTASGLFYESEVRDVNLYILITSMTIIMGITARNMTRTRVGRAFIAIRDSDIEFG